MRKKTFLFGVVLVLSVMAFVGCGNNTNNSVTDQQASPEATHTDLRDDDYNDSEVSPGTGDGAVGDLEEGVDDAADGVGDAVDDVIDGTEDAVDDAADALDGDDTDNNNTKNNKTTKNN
jgi:hypothetical protein